MKNPVRNPIPAADLSLKIVQAFNDRWMLLTAGENQQGRFNTMTISWGALGMLWSKPMAMVVVRPSRYTYEFMERSDSFTLCAFPARFREALTLCGTKSGRNVDKVKAAGLNPIAAQQVGAPAFAEAELILECRKIYFDDLHPQNFLSSEIEGNYSGRDYHRLYLGEIVHLEGTPDYCKAAG